MYYLHHLRVNLSRQGFADKFVFGDEVRVLVRRRYLLSATNTLIFEEQTHLYYSSFF